MLVCYWLYLQIQQKDIFSNNFISESLQLFYHPLTWIAFILVFANWGIEAIKWKIASSPIIKLTYWEAFLGVFTGVSLGFITPHGIGDYAGRILQIGNRQRINLLGGIFISKMVQLFITVLLGSVVLTVMVRQGFFSNYLIMNIGLIHGVYFLTLLLLVFFIFRLQIIHLLKNKFTKKHLDAISDITSRQWFGLFFWSLLRYTVFTLQYLLLLYINDIPIDLLILLEGIIFIFLVKSIVPTLFDIGVREAAAVFFFSFYHLDIEKVLFSSLLLWLLNIVFPTFIGMFMIFRIKWFSKV